MLAGRAAFIGGCGGTSNTEAGMRFGIPVFGTAAHSWTMAFRDEEQSFRALQDLLGESSVFLIDTYDTLEGARLAARLGKPIWGVRLDSGDLVALSKQVRRILDDAGLQDAKIFATSDLDEYRVAELVRAGAPLDAFGVGTQLATSGDAPSLSAIYKLVELKDGGGLIFTAKFSDDKSTLPGAKQIYRYADHDVLALYSECNDEFQGEPLLRPILISGQRLEPPHARSTKLRSMPRKSIAALPERLRSLDEAEPYPVEMSPRLLAIAEDLRREFQPQLDEDSFFRCRYAVGFSLSCRSFVRSRRGENCSRARPADPLRRQTIRFQLFPPPTRMRKTIRNSNSGSRTA